MPVLRAQTCKGQLEWREAEDTGQWRGRASQIIFSKNVCAQNRQQYSPKMATRCNNILNYLCISIHF